LYFQIPIPECLTFKLDDMKTKMSITFTIIGMVITGLFISCQNQGNRLEQRVENKVENFRDNLNDLAEDENDKDFPNKLKEELADFEESMNDLREDMNEEGDRVNMTMRQAVNDLQSEARALRMKLERQTADFDTRTRTDADRRTTDVDRRTDADRRTDDDRIIADRDRRAGTDARRDTANDGIFRGDGDGLFSGDDDRYIRIDQEIRADFHNLRQNVNQWVDRLSAGTDDRRRRSD
jgi:hypothetical protein